MEFSPKHTWVGYILERVRNPCLVAIVKECADVINTDCEDEGELTQDEPCDCGWRWFTLYGTRNKFMSLEIFFRGIHGFHIVSEAERSGIVLSSSDQVTWALKLLATLWGTAQLKLTMILSWLYVFAPHDQKRFHRFAVPCAQTCFILSEWALSSHLIKLFHQSSCTLGLPSDQIPNKNMVPTDFPIFNFCLCYAGNVDVFNYCRSPFHCLRSGLIRFSENSKVCLVSLDGSILLMCPKIAVTFSPCLCIPLFHYYYQVYMLVRLCIMDLIFF